MKDLSHFLIALLSATLSACVVVPKQVASYDPNCAVSTNKYELSIEQIEEFNALNCDSNNGCRLDFAEEIVSSALMLTTSAIVSGSIALTGNTLYWLETQGKCPDSRPQKMPEPNQKEAPYDTYEIKEEIITAKS